MASNTDAKLLRHIHTNMNGLRNIGPNSNAQYKFELEKSSFDKMDDDSPMPTGEWVIIGRIFPKKDAVYGGRPLRIEFKLSRTYPGTAPEVRVLQQVYHPNVSSKTGHVCVGSLLSTGSYKPSTTLAEVVADVTKLLDEPSIDNIENSEAAVLRSSDPAAYQTKAKEEFAANKSYPQS